MAGRRAVTAGILALAALAAGCGREPPPAPEPTEAAATPSAWRRVDGSAGVAVPPRSDDPALAETIGRARETLDEARRRWKAAGAGDRAHWAIKWAAPTAGGGVEHLWVRPEHWSRFRIEGRLANPPREPLQCGRTLGERVSFPVEAATDWVHFVEGRTDGPREGGWTIDLLERRYGKPGEKESRE